jgi:hypothetical protein
MIAIFRMGLVPEKGLGGSDTLTSFVGSFGRSRTRRLRVTISKNFRVSREIQKRSSVVG